jgi:hypothetical protein
MKNQQGLAATLLTNIVGIRVGKRARQRRPIPPGYVIRYTKVGQAYLVKEGETDMVADKEAAEEHVRKGSKVPFCASNETLAKTFGEGIYQYFDFIWFLVVINLVLFCLGSLGSKGEKRVCGLHRLSHRTGEFNCPFYH